MSERVISRFKTVDDDGKHHTIVIRETTTTSKELRLDRMSVPPEKDRYFETEDGHPITQIDDNTFHISVLDKLVKRIKQ